MKKMIVLLLTVLCVALVLLASAVCVGCNGVSQQPTQATPPPPPSSAAPSLAGGWQIILISSSPSNTNTVLEANLTQPTVNDVAIANAQNFYAFGLASGHTQVDGSPLTIGGQCGSSSSDNISVTLNSYTLVSGNPGTVADVDLQFSFNRNGSTFIGTGTGVIGTGDTIGRGGPSSGSYSSTGECADSGTWAAISGDSVGYRNLQSGSLPSTADPEPYNGQFCIGGDGAWVSHGPISQNEFGATFQCNGWFLQYISPNNPDGTPSPSYVADLTIVNGQKTEFSAAGSPVYSLGTFNWFVFSVVDPITYATTLYAYDTDGTFVTDFDGTCHDTGSGCN